MDFPLSFSGPPTKCPEMYCVRRAMFAVGTEDCSVMKKYIDWVFDDIIIRQKLQITSLAFFFTSRICRQFAANYKKNNRITKTTLLPMAYVDMAPSGLGLVTYGDLAFAKMAAESNPGRDDLIELFVNLKKFGFNDSILNSLPEE